MSLNVHWKARLVFLGVLGAAGIGVWYYLSPAGQVPYAIETHDAVSGLAAGAPVEMHGVEVGTVRSVRLSDPGTVQILIGVDRDAPITRATTAVLTARGLAARGFMGYVYIALESTGTDVQPLRAGAGKPYPVIPMAPPQINTVDTTAVAAIQEIRTLTRLLQPLLDPSTIAAIQQSAHDARDLLAVLVANQDRLKSLLASMEQDSRQIERLLDEKTVASLKQSADGLQSVVGTLAANSQTLTALMQNAEQDSRDLKPLLNATGLVARQLRAELLPQLYQTVGDLDRLTHAVKPLAVRAGRDPSNLLRGTQVPPGPGEQ